MSPADEAVAVVLEKRLAFRAAQIESEACAAVCRQARENMESALAALNIAEKALLALAGNPT